MFERGELVEHAAGTPNVCLVVVRPLLANLRRKVVGCPDAGASETARVVERLRDAEVANLAQTTRVEKHVLQ